MSALQNIQSNCGCQYTLTLTNEIVQEHYSETKDSFNHVPSIHEVDEEETDEEQIVDQEFETPNEIEQTTDLTKDIVDENSSYSNDSFCSDVDSCNESEESKDTSRSLDNSHFSHSATTRKSNNLNDSKREEEEESENATTCDNEMANSICGKSAMSEDSYIEVKQARNRRRNMSFTDEELRKIEWENQILLRKIMAQQRPKEKLLHDYVPPPRVSSSAINRRKLQKRIENENIMLLQRIQQTKSRVMNSTTKPGYRQTIL